MKKFLVLSSVLIAVSGSAAHADAQEGRGVLPTSSAMVCSRPDTQLGEGYSVQILGSKVVLRSDAQVLGELLGDADFRQLAQNFAVHGRAACQIVPGEVRQLSLNMVTVVLLLIQAR